MNFFRRFLGWPFLLVILVSFYLGSGLARPSERGEKRSLSFDAAPLEALEWRCIGPYWARPTDQSRQLFDELEAAADVELAQLRNILEKEVPALNAKLKEAGLPHVLVK